MAREIATTSKGSSMRFDNESDEDDNTARGQKSKAVVRQSNVAKDTSRLFLKDDTSIEFFILDKDVSRSIVVELDRLINECGGEVISEPPDEGYVLVDTRTEEAANYISSRSTATRRVVSYLFVKESIARGRIVPYSDLVLFIKEDRPVMFHLHESLGRDESERLKDTIMLRGGNPDASLRNAQVLIHAEDWRDKSVIARKYKGISHFETAKWLEACIRAKRFSLGDRVGTIPKPVKTPGRRPGATRNDYTPHDDKCLIGWMAHYFGKSMAGRAGNKPYQLMVDNPQCAAWAHRHTWQSWRERYKTRKSHFDPLIEAHIAKHHGDKLNDNASFVMGDESDADENDDELDDDDDELDDDEDGTPPAPTPRPKRKTRDASGVSGKPSGSKATGGKETRPTKKAKTTRAPKEAEEGEGEEEGEQEEEVPIKISASQRTAKPQNPRPKKKDKAPLEPERDDDDREDMQIKTSASQRPNKPRQSPSPPLDSPPFPPTEQGPHRRESGPGLPPPDVSDLIEVDESQEESQGSTQMTPHFGILENSTNAQDEVNRLNAELAAVEQQRQISDEEVEEYEDPDVDVVGVTQVDTPPGSPMARDEDGYEETPEDAGGTEIENVSIQLQQLADEFGVALNRVKGIYEAISPDLDEREALDSLRRELKKTKKARRGKGRAT